VVSDGWPVISGPTYSGQWSVASGQLLEDYGVASDWWSVAGRLWSGQWSVAGGRLLEKDLNGKVGQARGWNF